MTATPSVRGRALLAVALMIGFYALALGLCGALGLLIWFDVEQGRPHGRLILFSAMRERIALADVPVAFRGAPIGLITAGLMALAFMGFSGLATW